MFIGSGVHGSCVHGSCVHRFMCPYVQVLKAHVLVGPCVHVSMF